MTKVNGILNDKNEWIRFSVPINENILKLLINPVKKLSYSYPLNSDTRYKVHFNKKLEPGSNHSNGMKTYKQVNYQNLKDYKLIFLFILNNKLLQNKRY